MKNSDPQLDTKIKVEKDFLLISAAGSYSLTKANDLFKLAIDTTLLHDKGKILIDVTNVTGSIPFFDRFEFSEFLSQYKIKHALGKIDKIAVVGQEPVIHKKRFGETVAINRGLNARVFTDMKEALIWLNQH